METMKKQIYALAGVREDLFFLPEKFSHRLFQVILIATTAIAAVVFTGLFADQLQPAPSLSNVHILNTLQSYTAQSDSQILNTVPLFLAQQGTLGGIDTQSGQIQSLSASSFIPRAICTANISDNLDDVIEYIANNVPDASTTLRQQILSRAGEPQTYCYLPRDTISYDPSHILMYRFTKVTRFFYYFDIVIVALSLTIFWALLISNIYYRGFIYTKYGRAKMKIRHYQKDF